MTFYVTFYKYMYMLKAFLGYLILPLVFTRNIYNYLIIVISSHMDEANFQLCQYSIGIHVTWIPFSDIGKTNS